jgi:micrococcal nuclease
VSGGERVRLIGIDAPEEGHPGRPGECFARQATAFLRRLALGRQVELETDVERRDRFGRLLAYLWLGDRLVNETLVVEGYAVAGTYPPNVRYQQRLDAAQHRARTGQGGLWGACR